MAAAAPARDLLPGQERFVALASMAAPTVLPKPLPYIDAHPCRLGQRSHVLQAHPVGQVLLLQRPQQDGVHA